VGVPMKSSEIAAIGRLAGLAAAGVASHVEQMHEAIADRSFGPSGSLRAVGRPVHDGIARPIYALTRGSLRAAGTVAGRVAGAVGAPVEGVPLGATPGSNQVLAALNAVIGNQLHADGDPLAIQTAVRLNGRDVSPERSALRVAFPSATSRLVVFVHGLGETEHSWRLDAGPEDVTYGSRLAGDLGYSPVYVRYNTGRHISDNGVDLSRLLSQLVAAWPVPVTELLVVGHSMGGLVTRAACHYGAEASAPWVPLVRDVVYLGSPHTGAAAARASRTLSWALARVPETRGYAALLDHSPGVRDLRFGYVLDADWSDCDAGDCRDDHGNEVPLLATANHFVVSATLFGDQASGAGRVIGDLLVTPASALGRHRRRGPLEFHAAANRAGRHHFHLLNDPGVYELMRSWLTEQPEPTPPTAVAPGARRRLEAAAGRGPTT
jgi:pimeloyl-ACP methyl ester carboxylesterase